MKSEIDIAFALLKSTLAGSEEQVNLNSHDWWGLFRLLQKNHVAALAAESIAQLPETQQPPRDVLIPWLAEQEKSAAWFRYQQQVQQSIVDLLHKHGIETLVLKGTRTAQHYPLPELREFGDLDLYFYDKHDEADHIIQRHFGVDITNDVNHHTKYNIRGVTVESHYHLLNHYHPHSNRNYEALLKQLVETNPSTFEILFLLRHMACHFVASRITLRDLVDWTLTCRALDKQVDWAVVERTVSDYGMSQFTAALCQIAERRLAAHFSLNFPISADLDTIERDIVYGSLQAADHDHEDIHRFFWKLRRYRANRWKQRLVFNDTSFSLLFSNLSAHTRNPRSILHKM